MKNEFKWFTTLKGQLSNNDIDSIFLKIFHDLALDAFQGLILLTG